MTDQPKAPALPEVTLLAGLAGEAVEAAALGQAVAIAVLGAELQGLADQFAGGAGPRPPEEMKKVETEVEAGFDNMPV